MKKLLAVIVVIAIIAVSMPAFATRAEELQKRYAELVQQRIKINEELLRIEGAFSELQRIEAEAKAEAEEIDKAISQVSPDEIK